MIKLIDILKEITEGKQVGTLYHFTSFNGLKGILKSNILKVGDDSNFETGGNPGMVSLTRNKNLWYFPFRIELDGNKLSYNYKISPYQWSGGDHKSEMEEEIGRNITNVKSYITGISIWLNDEFILQGDISPKEIKQSQKLYPNLKFLYQDKKEKNYIPDPNPTYISSEQANTIIDSF